MVSHLSKEQDRFSLLFLEEGEYYFQDYACHLLAKGKPRCDKDMVQPLLLIDGCRKGALRKRYHHAISDLWQRTMSSWNTSVHSNTVH